MASFNPTSYQQDHCSFSHPSSPLDPNQPPMERCGTFDASNPEHIKAALEELAFRHVDRDSVVFSCKIFDERDVPLPVAFFDKALLNPNERKRKCDEPYSAERKVIITPNGAIEKTPG